MNSAIPSQPNSLNDEPEETLWTGGFAARSMAGAWVSALLVSCLLASAVYFIQPLRDNPTVWLTLILLLAFIWGVLLLSLVSRKLGQHYEITNHQLKHRSGILVRRVNRIEMIDIDDVMYQQGPLQALLNVGTIQLLSSDTSHPNLLMPGIVEVSKVANLIDSARRSERLKRGLHVESI